MLRIAGKNPPDMFTKEEKSVEYFEQIRDSLMMTEEQFDIDDNNHFLYIISNA